MASFRRERDSEYEKGAERYRRAKKAKAERHRRREERSKSWSDLPEDIIVSIKERLYVADRIRFRAVCRNWSVQSADLQTATVDKLPWTMEYKWRNPKSWSKNSSICKVYEPLNRNRTTSHVVVEHERMFYEEVENGRITVGRRSFVNVEAHASCDGWILLYEHLLEDVLFFFNPLTKTVINIPKLESRGFELATCSSAPVSPTCSVFAMCKAVGGDRYIHIYSHATKTWKAHHLISSNGLHPQLGEPIGVCYLERTGTIYCSFTGFYLVAFDIASGKPSLVVTPDPGLDHHLFLNELILRGRIRWTGILGCDGDLFLLYLSETMPRIELCYKWYVLKLDWERKEWVQVNSLDGRAMFVGDVSFCVSAGGETEIVANRIYHFRDGVPYYHTLDGHDSLDPDDRKREEVNAKIFGCCRAGRKILWLQPPK